jgi:hypothetical protein
MDDIDIVEIGSVLLPSIDQQKTVRFLEGNTLCAVEELVLKRAEECGW